MKLCPERSIQNISYKAIDSNEKKKKLSSLLEKEIFSELPFYYKRNVFSFLNQMDRNLEKKNIGAEEIRSACLEVLYNFMPLYQAQTKNPYQSYFYILFRFSLLFF